MTGMPNRYEDIPEDSNMHGVAIVRQELKRLRRKKRLTNVRELPGMVTLFLRVRTEKLFQRRIRQLDCDVKA